MTYITTFILSLFLCLAIMPLVMAFARRFNLIDKPNARKVHKRAIPRVGGIAFIAAMCIAIAAGVCFMPAVREQFAAMQKQVIVLIAASLFVSLVGLVDDARGLSGRFKFLSLILASLAVCWSGSYVRVLAVGTVFTLDLGFFAWPLTVLWITGVTVGVNFLDGLDGLAGGLSSIAAAAIAVLAFYLGLPAVGIIMLALLGSLTGFLFFNYNPAKVFMGDCGSMFLGFLLGASSVICTSKSGSIETLGIAAVALGIPIIDTACTMIRRVILERRSMFHAERGHIHHRLLDLGLNQRHVVMVLYFVTFITTALAMFTLVTKDYNTVAILLCILLLYMIFFRAIGSYNVRQIIAAIRRNKAIKQSTKGFRVHFEDMQLEFRRAETFDQWWKLTSTAANRLGFQSITMKIKNRDGTQRILEWKRDNSAIQSACHAEASGEGGNAESRQLTAERSTESRQLNADRSTTDRRPLIAERSTESSTESPKPQAESRPLNAERSTSARRPLTADRLLAIELPIKDRRQKQPLRLQIEALSNNSLESTGTRLTLFMRLLDEHGIANLPKQESDAPEVNTTLNT